MLSMKDAKQIMNYFGFVSNSVEPMLCEYKEQIGIFATFKTKYGHLSRFIPFKEKEDIKNFLKIYLWYRNKINDSKMIVSFDDYKILSPKIEFIYNEKLLTVTNLHDINLISTNVEELIIDSSFDNNLNKIELILTKINDSYKEIEDLEKKLSKTIEIYKSKFNEYNKLLEIKENINITIDEFNRNFVEEKVEEVKKRLYKDLDENFNYYCNELLLLLENVLLDSNYLNSIYLIDYYNKEVEIIDMKIRKYQEYLEIPETTKGKLFKSKKTKPDFELYLKEQPLEQNNVDKNEIYKKQNSKVKRIIDNIRKEIKEEPKKEFDDYQNINNETINELDINGLNTYFMSLDFTQRNKNLLLFSPVKELINLVISIKENENKTNIIMCEKYYLEKFKEIYDILSSQDNYAATRKYLKLIKLDSLEEFVDSIVIITNDLNIKPFILNKNIELKYKMGVVLKEGYINASANNFYPINNRGLNNYYVSKVLEKINVYYSPYIIKIDNDNNIVAVENDGVIAFDISNLSIINKSEILVKNYVIKKNKNKEIIFSIFNEKNYIISDIINN